MGAPGSVVYYTCLCLLTWTLIDAKPIADDNAIESSTSLIVAIGCVGLAVFVIVMAFGYDLLLGTTDNENKCCSCCSCNITVWNCQPYNIGRDSNYTDGYIEFFYHIIYILRIVF